MKQLLFAGLAAGSLFFTSCGDKKADTGVDKSNLKANEAVDNWKKDMTEGRVASLWDALPSTYQSDVSSIIHSVGEKVDAEVYDEAMKTVSAATALLKNKKSMILEMAKEQTPKGMESQVENVEANYDSIVGLLNAIATSDAKSVDGLKKLDVAKFLGDIQTHTKELASLASLAGDEMEKIKSATATLISESGDTAEVEMTVEDSKKTVKFVKKDDRWIPEDMANEWPDMMKEAKAGIGEMSKMEPEQKQQALMMMGMVQSTIKSLEEAETKEEMMEKMGGLMKMFGGM